MEHSKQRVYLDHHATTPVDSRVLEAMLPFFSTAFGNPASSHSFGDETGLAVATARRQIARLVGATVAREIVFTSGATESNNLAVRGVFSAATRAGNARPHIISSPIEHPSVLEAARWVAANGGSWTQVGVDRHGLVSAAEVEAALRPETALISVMMVNNEVGTIQPLEEIGAIARRHEVLLHTDAAQAAGRVSIDVQRDNVDLLSLSAHKIYGPKGVGALYLRRVPQRVALEPMMLGGGQEGGARSGTLNVPGIVGFGRAAELAEQTRDEEMSRQSHLRTLVLDRIRGHELDFIVHGSLEHRVAGNLNLSILGVPADGLLNAVPELAISTRSACSSASPEVSHTLKAMGIDHDHARSAIRIGIGRGTTEEDILYAVERLASAAKKMMRRAA